MERAPIRCWLLVLALLVGAQALAAGSRRSDELLEQQLAQARSKLAPGQPARVIYAGFAMHPDSTAFRGDVELGEKVVRAIDPEAVVFKLSSAGYGLPRDWPLATRDNIATVLQVVGEAARPQDKVVVLMTSHGLYHQIAVQAENGRMEALGPFDLQRWLQALRGKPTLVLLSACYSGSFMQALRGPSRIVLTASSAERPSFGCQPESRNTFFIEELFTQPRVAQRSIEDLVQQGYAAIEKRERGMKLDPSQPQASFGAAVQGWSRQRLADWLKANP
jgi:hypothetical protein